MDRRSIRTDKLLKSTLLSLLLKKNIQNITITELMKNANLDRRTFYLHYNDIYALYEAIQTDFINEFLIIFETAEIKEQLKNKPISIISITIYFLYSHADICIANLGVNFDYNLAHQFLEILRARALSLIQNIHPKCSSLKIETYYTFCVYGSFGIIRQWIENNLAAKEEEIIAQIEELAICAEKYLY